ncbi:hypothetical protein GQ53DRAFT_841609 [Thozetella sp. PMI_491]|nr:hypothetical protein GQ53DRAFT_841609 [Thozetella sp. PMI_491]
MPREAKPGHGPNQHTVTSCKRCRQKKLKCDDLSRSCRNCIKAGSECTTIDAISKQEYSRSYVDDLVAKIQDLEKVIRNAQPVEDRQVSDSVEEAVVYPAARDPPTVASEGAAATVASASSGQYHGTGSVISMARLVAAAVSAKAATRNFLTDDATSLELFQMDYNSATPASPPDAEVAQLLLQAYFAGPHILHPFLEREKIEALFAEAASGVLFDPARVFRYFMICATGALPLNRHGTHDIPAINYYVAAMRHQQQALTMKGIEQVQHILLILVFAGQYETGIGHKWDLARLAIRTCIAQGLHKRTTAPLESMQEQMRRRVFWAAYVNERHASATVGRPFAILDSNISIELPYDADDDLVGNSEFLRLQSSRGLSEAGIQLRQIRIRQFTSQIQQALVAQERKPQEPVNHIFLPILDELDEWRKTIDPGVVTSGGIYATEAWVDLSYQKERLSCLRAMVLSFQRGAQTSDSKLRDVGMCLHAAVQVVQCYQNLASSDQRVMNWTCVQDILTSGFVILYCLMRAQEMLRGKSHGHNIFQGQWPAERRDDGSEQVASGTQGKEQEKRWKQLFDLEKSQIVAFEALRTCSSFLEHIASRWKTLEKQREIFDGLANEIRRQLERPLLTTDGGRESFGEQNIVLGRDSNQILGPQPGMLQLYDTVATYQPQDTELFSVFTPAEIDPDLASLGFYGIDLDSLDWQQIFSSGNQNFSLDEIGLA